MARTISAVRAARSSNEMPRASNSSWSQPIPMPKMARPFDSTSSVASDSATSTGSRWASSVTPVESFSVDVRAATAASSSSGADTM